MRIFVVNVTTDEFGARVPNAVLTPPYVCHEFDSRGSGEKFLCVSSDTAAVAGTVDFGDPSDPTWTSTVMTPSERNYMNTEYGSSFVSGDTYGMALEFLVKTKNWVIRFPGGPALLPLRRSAP